MYETGTRNQARTMKHDNAPQSKKRQIPGHREAPADRKAFGDRPASHWIIPRNTYGWAVLITLLIAAWFLTGQVVVGGRKAEHAAQNTPSAQSSSSEAASKQTPFAVQTLLSTAKLREAVLELRGHTQADAKVQVRAQTSGVVKQIHDGKGQFVHAGTLLCAIEPGARKAELARARAKQAEARQKYVSTRRLHSKGHASKSSLLTEKARYEAAIAAAEKARLDLNYTQIKAPISGIVDEQPARRGDYLPISGVCATLVKLNPLIVRANVSENDVSKLHVSQNGTARLVTGETVSGRIRYISAMADPKTRTFKIELAVKNPNNRLRDGVTAVLRIPLAKSSGHFLPPSLLVLDAGGRVGVRTVDANNFIRFKPVEILSHEKNGVWVTGLAQSERIVSVGQDYVRDGQKVALPTQKEPAIAAQKLVSQQPRANSETQ